MKKTKVFKNGVAGLWLFLIVVALIGYQINNISTYGYYVENTNFFSKANIALWIITMFFGYFLVKHVKECKEKSASTAALKYTGFQLKKLLPLLIIGYILGITICTSYYYPNYDINQICNLIINGFWNFLGLGSSSFANSQIAILNEPLWLVSSIIIAGYFLYFGLCKDEEITAGLIAPLIFILFGGYSYFNGFNGLSFVLISMSVGIILYYLVDKLQKHEFTEFGKWLLTIIYLICATLLIWYIIYPDVGLQENMVILLSIIIVFLTMLQKDKLTSFLNITSVNNLFSYLGSVAIYIYILTAPIAIFVIKLLGGNTSSSPYSFWSIFIPVMILIIVFSMLLKTAIEIFKENWALAKAEEMSEHKKGIRK